MALIIGSGLPKPKYGSALVISHFSALEAFRRARWEGDYQVRELLADLYPDSLIRKLDADSLAADETLRPLLLPADAAERATRVRPLLGLDESRSIDVVVGRSIARRRGSGLSSHVWTGPVADGLISQLDAHLYLCGPEVLFLQLARVLPRPALLELGFELCGTYAIGPKGHEFRNGAVSLTTPERLAWLAGLAAGVKGSKAARWAASHVLPGSRSPKESQLAILLSLPRCEGGWGCPRPVMNFGVELTPQARRHCDRNVLYADLYFEAARMDVEYHGARWHSRLIDKSRDDARSNALAMMDVECNVVWSTQLYDETKMEGIANFIRKRSGTRSYRTPENGTMRLARLRLLDAFRSSGWDDEPQ